MSALAMQPVVLSEVGLGTRTRTAYSRHRDSPPWPTASAARRRALQRRRLPCRQRRRLVHLPTARWAVTAVQARAGDRLLLCSDGVTDYLTDAELADLLRIEDAGCAVRRLVDSALDQGSRDNLTAVIADVVTRADPDDRWLEALPAATDSA